jgi:hypothetical protein
MGPQFAVLGIAFCLLLMTRMGRAELYIMIATAGLALLNWLWARRAPAAA